MRIPDFVLCLLFVFIIPEVYHSCWVPQAKLRPERLETLEDVDTCVLYYNYAVILYHLRQYRAALGIVSKISRYIEPLGEYPHAARLRCDNPAELDPLAALPALDVTRERNIQQDWFFPRQLRDRRPDNTLFRLFCVYLRGYLRLFAF